MCWQQSCWWPIINYYSQQPNMKEITVLTFGAIAEIVGKNSLVLTNVSSTGELKQKLEAEYPRLKNIEYAIAVDKQMTSSSIPLETKSTVALLPPFSGG